MNLKIPSADWNQAVRYIKTFTKMLKGFTPPQHLHVLLDVNQNQLQRLWRQNSIAINIDGNNKRIDFKNKITCTRKGFVDVEQLIAQNIADDKNVDPEIGVFQYWICAYDAGKMMITERLVKESGLEETVLSPLVDMALSPMIAQAIKHGTVSLPKLEKSAGGGGRRGKPKS
jgi:hypothetical protein